MAHCQEGNSAKRTHSVLGGIGKIVSVAVFVRNVGGLTFFNWFWNFPRIAAGPSQLPYCGERDPGL